MVREGLSSEPVERRLPRPEAQPQPVEHEAFDYEEAGFDSAEQAEKASAKIVEIAREKDRAKADKLRAELRAMLDDMEGDEPAPSNAALLEKRLAETRAGQAELDRRDQESRSRKYEPTGLKADGKGPMVKAENNQAMEIQHIRLRQETLAPMLSALEEANQSGDTQRVDALHKEIYAYFEKVKSAQEEVRQATLSGDAKGDIDLRLAPEATPEGRQRFEAAIKQNMDKMAKDLEENQESLGGSEYMEHKKRQAEEAAEREAAKARELEVKAAELSPDAITEFDQNTEGVISAERTQPDVDFTADVEAEAPTERMDESERFGQAEGWSFDQDNGARAQSFFETHQPEAFVTDTKLQEQLQAGEITAKALEARANENRRAYDELVDTIKYYRPDAQLPGYDEALRRPEVTISRVLAGEMGVQEDREHESPALAVELADRYQQIVFAGENLERVLQTLPESESNLAEAGQDKRNAA